MSRELSCTDRWNFVPCFDFVFGKQTVLNIIPLVLRRVVSFWALIIIIIIDFFKLLFLLALRLVFFLLDWRMWVLVLVFGFGLWLMEEYWHFVAELLRMLFPLFIALLNITIMFMNLGITIYGFIAMLWNLLVPFIGMIFNLFLGLFMMMCKLIAKFFGGGGNSARHLLGLGDAFSGIIEVIMKLLGTIMEIVGEVIGAIIRLDEKLLQTFVTIIGAVLTFVFKIAGILFSVLKFVFQLVFPILAPIIKIIGFFFGGGSGSNAGTQAYAASRVMLQTREQEKFKQMFNPVQDHTRLPNAQPQQQQSESTPTTKTDIDSYNGDMFVHDYLSGLRDVHRVHPVDKTHGLVTSILHWYAVPENARSIADIDSYESYHASTWLNPAVSPLSAHQIETRGLERVPFHVEHEFGTPDNQQSVAFGLFHVGRETFKKAHEYVRSGNMKRHVDQFAQNMNFINFENLIDHVANTYTDPTEIIHDYSPSNSDLFLNISEAIDPDFHTRPFWGHYVKTDPRGGITLPNGKRAMVILDTSMLSRLDCYNTVPRNPLCLPEFPKNFQIPPVSFGWQIDWNDNKDCPMLKTSCIYCYERVFNAFMDLIIWASVIFLAIIGIEALLMQFPAFSPVFHALIPLQWRALPKFRDYLCTFIYLYDLFVNIIILYLFYLFVAPILWFFVGIIRHIVYHIMRLRAWATSDHLRYLFVDPRTVKYATDHTVFEQPAPKPVRLGRIQQSAIGGEFNSSATPQHVFKTWHRSRSCVFLDAPERVSRSGRKRIALDIEASSSSNIDNVSDEYLHRIETLGHLVDRYASVYGRNPSPDATNYTEDVKKGTMFGILNTLEHFHPLHSLSISFILQLRKAIDENFVGAPLNPFDEHIHQICKENQ
jgi:hypothetical protein